MKKLVFLGACLLALASLPARAQTQESEVVVVQIGRPGLASTAQVVVNRGTAQAELLRIKLTDISEQAASFQKLFAQLAQQGYSIKSTFTIADGSTTIVLMKNK